MSTMHGPTEPTPGVPAGAIPQPPPPSPRNDPEDPFARSGDTDVVFRLERDVPLVHRLRELAVNGVELLLENWRMVAAGGVALTAVVALAIVVGGAYRAHSAPAPAATPAAPAPPPAVAQPAEAAAPAAMPPAAAVPVAEPARPAARPIRVRPRPVHSPPGSLPAKKNFTAAPSPAHR
jgi:hypothetical protein